MLGYPNLQQLMEIVYHDGHEAHKPHHLESQTEYDKLLGCFLP